MTEIQDAAAELKCLQASPIPGTMKINSVVAVGGILYVRDTSCFKPCCYKDGKFLLTALARKCITWEKGEKNRHR